MKLPVWLWMVVLSIVFVVFALLGVFVYRLASEHGTLGKTRETANTINQPTEAISVEVPELPGFEDEPQPLPCQIEVSSLDPRFRVSQSDEFLKQWVGLLGVCNNDSFQIHIPDGSRSEVLGLRVVFDGSAQYPGKVTDNTGKTMHSYEIGKSDRWGVVRINIQDFYTSEYAQLEGAYATIVERTLFTALLPNYDSSLKAETLEQSNLLIRQAIEVESS